MLASIENWYPIKYFVALTVENIFLQLSYNDFLIYNVYKTMDIFGPSVLLHFLDHIIVQSEKSLKYPINYLNWYKITVHPTFGLPNTRDVNLLAQQYPYV